MERSFLGIGLKEIIILIFLLLSGLLPLVLLYFISGVSSAEPKNKYYQQPIEQDVEKSDELKEFAEEIYKMSYSEKYL